MKQVAILYSDKDIEEVRKIGGDRYNYFFQAGRVIISSNWYGTKNGQIDHLTPLAKTLEEGMGVHIVNVPDINPVVVTQGGALHVTHKKGHDYYVFNLKTTLAHFGISWRTNTTGEYVGKQLEVDKFVLVGEGNALRDVRRWISYQLKLGRTWFGIDDLEEIIRRSKRYDFKALAVLKNGAVMDLVKHTFIYTGKRNSDLHCILEGWTDVPVSGGCKGHIPRNPVETMLNEAHEKGQ